MDLRNILSATGSQFIAQIIYPDVDLTALKGDAYLIGWNLDSFRCSIACIVPIAENRLADLNEALSKSSSDLAGTLSTCSKYGRSKPIVLGELIVSNDSSYIPSPDKQARGIWITLCYEKFDDNTVSLKPKLHSLYSLGCKYDTSVNIFRYQRAASQRLECFFVKRTYRNQKLQQDNKSETSYTTERANNSSKGSPLTDLEVVIGHINTANELRNRLDFYLDIAAGRPINQSYYYITEKPFVSSADRYFSKLIGCVCMAMSRVVDVWCRFLRLLHRLLIYRFEFLRLGSGISQWLGLSGAGSIETAGSINNNTGASKGISMRDLSLTAAFVSERASMCNLAIQKCALFPLAWNLPCAMKQRLWLEVHALVLLIWVDVLLGVLFGYFVFTRAESIIQQAGALCQHLETTYILETLQWFNHLPGGVKLNTTITQRMSSILTGVVLIFETCLSATQPWHSALLRFIACCGGFGCSVQLVMVVDLMRLLSVHIALVHRVLSYFHHFLLQCLHSLWLLFNGQKNNVLRKRIDTCYFNQDQLLFGIVQFSIAFFVFPNFAAYFFLFALAQFVCVAVQYVVYALSVLLKEFPYYEAVMFVTCPGIMSDGVQFSMQLPELSAVTSSSVSCELSDLRDAFSVNCLRDSWRTLSAAPMVTGSSMSERSSSSLLSSSSSVAGQRAKTSPKHSLDARRRALEPSAGPANSLTLEASLIRSRSSEGSERGTESPGRDTPPSNNNTAARPRGILKAASHRQSFSRTGPVHASLAAQARDHTPINNDSPAREVVSAERAVGRVTFQGNTVRTIEQYVSDGESEDEGQLLLSPPQSQPPQGAITLEESKQQQEYAMSASRPTKQPLTILSNAPSMRGMQKPKPKHSSSGSTTYIDLKARSMSKTSLFVAYFNHMSYYSNERGMLFRLLRGIVTGRPALDIQLIHGTSDIVDRREATERALMLEVVSLATSSSNDYSSSKDYPGTANENDSNTHSERPRRDQEFARAGSIPRAVWALRASPSFAESVRLAWAGDDRQAFSEETNPASATRNADTDATDNGRLHLETDALLEKEPFLMRESQRQVPRSLHCRTLSRRMLFIVLLTLCISFLMSMCGMVLFAASSAFVVVHPGRSGVLSGVHASPLGPARSRAVVAVISPGRNISEAATSIDLDKVTATSAHIEIIAAVHTHGLSN